MVVGRLLSYWESNFSGAMLNFGSVPELSVILELPGRFHFRSGLSFPLWDNGCRQMGGEPILMEEIKHSPSNELYCALVTIEYYLIIIYH